MIKNILLKIQGERMEFARKIDGAVFFVDLLGMGALTQYNLSLNDNDYEPWLRDKGVEYTDQFFAAALLDKFREILQRLLKKYEDIEVAQLSDCAFIWSKNITEVVLFANNFMTESLKQGVLCRGGLASGEIIYVHQNDTHSMGRFIVGDAVSKAVKLEGLAKGARVLIDQKLPSVLCDYDEEFYLKIQKLFSPFVNPLDYATYDEFKWYIIPDLSSQIKNLDYLTNKQRLEFTKERIKLATRVRYSPKFNWNVASSQGVVHIKASLDFLTIHDEEILKVEHDFRWSAEFISEIYSTTPKEKQIRNDSKLDKILSIVAMSDQYSIKK